MKTIKFFLVILTLFLVSCSKEVDLKISRQDKIIAIGDSLTYGYGSKISWTEHFNKITGFDVINLGINGAKTEDVLKNLQNQIDENKPDVIFLSIGGNDFIHSIDEQKTKNNLISTIRFIQNSNIKLVLISQPKPSISGAVGFLKDHPLYKDISKQENVFLVENIWTNILEDSNKKSDLIHPNEDGYKDFANKFYKELLNNKIID